MKKVCARCSEKGITRPGVLVYVTREPIEVAIPLCADCSREVQNSDDTTGAMSWTEEPGQDAVFGSAKR